MSYQKFGRLFLLLLVPMLVHCSSKDEANPQPANNSNSMSVSVPGIATVVFPPGSLPPSTQVTIEKTSSSETAEDFDVSAPMFSAGPRNSYEVRILSTSMPTKDFTADVTVPDNFLAALPSDSELQIFAQILALGEQDVLDNFELIPSTYSPVSKFLHVDLSKEAFTNDRRTDGLYEAILVIGSTPTLPTPLSNATALSPANASLPITRSFVSPERLHDSRVSPFSFTAAQASSGTCEGSSLGPPLEGTLTRTGAFNPPKHYGTDYRASNGDNVLAMADGTIDIVGFNEKIRANPDPRSGKKIKGWGRYVVIKHTDGSTSVYGHLIKDSTDSLKIGAKVNKGDVIAKSDNTGGSSAPHLHVEYIPNGKTFDKNSHVDPEPCIGSLISGSINVRDNGTIEDDSFRVTLNGVLLGETAIGGTNSFSASNLRSGTAVLAVTCLVAPDNIGTLSVSLADGLTLQDGSTSISDILTQGETKNYTITIP